MAPGQEPFIYPHEYKCRNRVLFRLLGPRLSVAQPRRLPASLWLHVYLLMFNLAIELSDKLLACINCHFEMPRNAIACLQGILRATSRSTMGQTQRCRERKHLARSR
jgi:hypothetical protein